MPPRPSGRPGGHEGLTRDDLRGLRRWVLVAGVWAVAATAIALIALLDTSGSDAQRDADAAADRSARTERTLDGRLDALDRRLESLPRSEDVSKIQQRLSRAEADASKSARDAKSADDQVTDLEDRVQTLEDAAESDSGADAGSADGSGGADQP